MGPVPEISHTSMRSSWAVPFLPIPGLREMQMTGKRVWKASSSMPKVNENKVGLGRTRESAPVKSNPKAAMSDIWT